MLFIYMHADKHIKKQHPSFIVWGVVFIIIWLIILNKNDYETKGIIKQLMYHIYKQVP